jgi:hypothetical protein
MSGGFFESVVPGDGGKPPDIDTSVAHQARVYDYLLDVIFSPGVSRGCDLRRPVVDGVLDGTLAA